MRPCSAIHPDPAATAGRCRVCHLSLAGHVWPAPPRGPCRHRGGEVRQVQCQSCAGKVRLKVLSCAMHGECTVSKPAAGLACCEACPDHRPPAWSHVAPLGTRDLAQAWEGRAGRKPWAYHSTAILPHLDTPDLLPLAVELLRLQTEPPYIVVIDTGSPPEVCERLEDLRGDDLEIHYVRAGGYTHSSEPVCVALDLGFARVNTEYAFLSHTDCFPVRRDLLAWLRGQCGAECPVVGWEMSERSWATDLWRGMVSHTCTMLHAPTMRRIGAGWHMQTGRDLLGYARSLNMGGWPDTETTFGLILQRHGITPLLLGGEVNYQRQTTEWWDHARSITGRRAYLAAGSEDLARVEAWTAEAVASAEGRIRSWRAEEAASPATAAGGQPRK